VSASELDTSFFAGRRFGLSMAGDVLKLKTAFIGQSTSPGGRRGRITKFSNQSRNRCLEYCSSLDPVVFAEAFFITLTYPAVFPMDGLITKNHLRRFHQAWNRKYGTARAVWKNEFQRRGAEHFHIAIVSAGIDIVECRIWVAKTWFDIVGSGDPLHLSAGTEVDILRADNPAGYFAGYMAKTGSSKEYQNIVPDGFINPGRFWGSWGLRPEPVFTDLAKNEFVDIRRILRRVAKARAPVRDRLDCNGVIQKTRRFMRSPGRFQGQWFYFRGSSNSRIIDQLGAVIGRPLLLC
jgi:hypothetical protein